MSKASDRAYAQLRDEIREGLLPPGAQLREEQIAIACRTSRTPVREALRRLESECFVRRTASKRTFVADWSLDEIDEAFLLRGMLEGYAAERAARLIDDAGLEELRAANRGIADAADGNSLDVIAFLNHNRAFHRAIMTAANSTRLVGLLGMIVEQPIVARTARQYDRAQIFQSHAEHEELILAFSRRDAEWAKAVMMSHIRRAFHVYHDTF